ncbi:MAG: hypothetical protein OXG65_14285 [Chloroflexi bacterium]|nr:hypothetical protein [Chloroflexota bacterium]
MTKEFPSSLAVEGKLPENGLAAYGLDGDDLLAPPHELVGEHKSRETVKAPALPLGGGRVHGRARLPSTGAGGVGEWGTLEPKRQPGNPDAPPRRAVAWCMEALA